MSDRSCFIKSTDWMNMPNKKHCCTKCSSGMLGCMQGRHRCSENNRLHKKSMLLHRMLYIVELLNHKKDSLEKQDKIQNRTMNMLKCCRLCNSEMCRCMFCTGCFHRKIHLSKMSMSMSRIDYNLQVMWCRKSKIRL